MKLSRWYYSPLLVLGAWWLPIMEANSAVSVVCRAGMNTDVGSTGNVNIGSKITPVDANNASLTFTLNYSCTNLGSDAGYVSVCLGADGGSYSPTNISPRYMSINGPGTNPRLAFTMTQNNILWGTRNGSGSEYNSGSRPIAARSSIKGQTSIKFSLVSDPSNVNATPGVYTSNFLDTGNTTLRYEDNDLAHPTGDCTTGIQIPVRFPFTVQATVIPSCSVTSASDVNLGSHSASKKSITGNNPSAINVTCTKGTPYTIGLMPSNKRVDGAGVMSGTGGNTDKIAYQLRSTTGIAGQIWGNTATSSTLGNGVLGIINGINQSYPVYVTVPSADFKPDDYSDKVTIQLNY